MSDDTATGTRGFFLFRHHFGQARTLRFCGSVAIDEMALSWCVSRKSCVFSSYTRSPVVDMTNRIFGFFSLPSLCCARTREIAVIIIGIPARVSVSLGVSVSVSVMCEYECAMVACVHVYVHVVFRTFAYACVSMRCMQVWVCACACFT